MTLYEKSLKTLELPAILTMLAAEAASAPAKEAAGALRPDGDIYEVRHRLEETTAAKRMIAGKGSPGFSGIRDVRAAIRRADMGGMLNTSELLDIAALLRCAGAGIAYASGEREEPTAIDYLFASLNGNKFLEGKISASIIGVDEIADAASPELASIRRHMRVAGEKVRQTLNKIITSPTYAKALQEAIITMRNDRYVVPVKAEYKSAVPGLVHDVSSSGATLFIEPVSVVQLNNEIRELIAKEKMEIDRILMELSADAAAHGENMIRDFEVLVRLDLIFAKAKLSYKQNASEPALSQEPALVLRHARHPLLAAKTAVPIDLRLGGEFDTLVITGPNTGGKTVTLKTLGLLCAMAQCGLHIPADDGSSVPVFDRILADIGDEQSIEQSLSTFSSHMTNIVKILADCGDRSLLLFDELGAGTDPVEGAALAIAIIEHARRTGGLIAATTHYSELKTYALTAKGVTNASCEFDVETLRPTYRLLIGVPGKSNAFAISQRLGLPGEIIEDARRRVGTEDAAFEEVMAKLEQTRLDMERERIETQRRLQSARTDAEKAEAYRREFEKEREKAAVLARREAARIVEDARRAADEVMEELSALRKSAGKGADWQQTNEAKSALYRKLNEAEQSLAPAPAREAAPAPETRAIRPGDRVKLLSLGTEADVISVGQDGMLTLQAGILKITARRDEVSLAEGKRKKEAVGYTQSVQPPLRESRAQPELDIRGMMTDEAIPVVERYLDSASLDKLESVTIIHGKGTGALRQAVHQCLKSEPQVKSFRLGRYGEGEAGVTVVELR